MYSNDNILMQYLYIATEYTHTLASYTDSTYYTIKIQAVIVIMHGT